LNLHKLANRSSTNHTTSYSIFHDQPLDSTSTPTPPTHHPTPPNPTPPPYPGPTTPQTQPPTPHPAAPAPPLLKKPAILENIYSHFDPAQPPPPGPEVWEVWGDRELVGRFVGMHFVGEGF